MDFPHRGFGRGDQQGEEEHHHHRPGHFFPRPPPHQHRAYEGEECPAAPYVEGERYAPFAPHQPYPPDAYPPTYTNPDVTYNHPSHAHHPPQTQYTPPAGPYDTHTSSGPYYTNPHEPSSEAYPSEPAHTSLLPQGQLVRVFCKGNSAFNLAVEHDTVVMKPANSQDEAQQWIKDVTYGLRVKDNYGHAAFSLVNKKTQKILKHAKEKGQQVLLIDYQPDIRDDDILWSESQDFGEGFKTVRSASDTLLNLTVFEGAKKIRNGSALVLDTWHKGDHQLWKLFAL